MNAMKRVWTGVRTVLAFAGAFALLLFVPLFFYHYNGPWLAKVARILSIH